MSEYRINAIDEEEPRKWTSPQGNVIFYITVGLDGHPKPVSIGKKSPDALKVGDTVHGTIIPTDYLTDKWKGEAPQGSSTINQSQVAVGFMKDMSNTPILMYNGSLHYAKDLGLNLITNEEDRRVYLEYVQIVSNEMLDMVEKVRGSGDPVSSSPVIKQAEKPATGLGDKFRALKEPELSDADIPPEYQ